MKHLILLILLTFAIPLPASTQAARVPLAPPDAVVIGADGFENDALHVPNYLRALASVQPQAVQPFAKLLRVTLTRGTLSPAVKTAMGVVVARHLGNNYAERHLTRLLNTSAQGRHLLVVSKTETSRGSLNEGERDRIALLYAARLTDDIHGIDDATFARVRSLFNDSEVVELTQTVCTMNYFTRLCAALGLTPEDWLATSAPKPLGDAADTMKARVSLASDAEMEWAAKIMSPSGADPWGLGVRVFNSQRAMLRSPEIGTAWMSYWQSVQAGAKVPRSILLQVSFAVSSANGCRYCTLHQVVGLRRLKVDIVKLQAMRENDDTLSSQEKPAVIFARKLSQNPPQVTDADFDALQTAFPSGGAIEIVLQTCAFAYMNRFTDNLRLPSEDEAVRTYQEVYGQGAYENYHAHRK